MSDMTRNKVLIVDDEPAIRMAIRRFLMLSACGFDMPDGYRTACEALVLSRSEGDLRRIRHGVQSWVDMLLLPRRAPFFGTLLFG